MKQPPLARRQHPLFSPIGLITTILLAGILAVTLWLTGGRLFSPGQLSAVGSGTPVATFTSHADFQDDCAQCHTPWQGLDPEQCEACHTDVGIERQAGTGVHGALEAVADCATCHSEHQGTTFDLSAHALPANFAHAQTNFQLMAHETDYQDASLECVDCHTPQTKFPEQAMGCLDCHATAAPDYMNKHVTAFGTSCTACHDGIDTIAHVTQADHATFFPLDGAHAEIGCDTCHAGNRSSTDFLNTPIACVGCHADPLFHQGFFGDNCVACHHTTAFKPAGIHPTLFDHARDTRFTLEKHVTNYDAIAFTCTTCHTEGTLRFPDNGCVNCHGGAEPTFMTDHITQFGTNCLGCHTGDGRLTNFDHNAIFALEGQHATAECTACHVEQTFQGTPRACVACHAEPEIHQGLFGISCESCHTAEGWLPAFLRQHSFPLDHGGEGQIPCATCHTQTYNEYTCYQCHDRNEMASEHAEEGIPPSELTNCVACHPTGEEK